MRSTPGTRLKSSAGILAIMVLVAGCLTNHHYDISGLVDQFPELKKSYIIGATYQTQRDLILLDAGGKYLELEEDLQSYRESDRFRGPVIRGTQIRILRLEYIKAPVAISCRVDAIGKEV